MLPADLRGLYEAYSEVYEEVDLIDEDLIEEIVEELVEDCLAFGYELEESLELVENAAIEYFDEIEDLEEAKVTYGSDTESPEQRRARAKEKLSGMKSAARKAAVKSAVSKVKQKSAGAAIGAYAAGKLAKSAAKSAVKGAARSASAAVQKKKAEVKSGVKKMLGAGLRAVAGGAGAVAQKARKVGAAAGKAAERLGEEAQQLDEISDRRVQGMLAKREKQDRDSGGISAGYMANRRAQQAAARRNVRTGSNVKVDPILSKEEVELDALIESLVERGHTEQEAYALVAQFTLDEDSRRMSNKQKTASVRQNIKAFGSNFTPPNNYDPDANRGQGEVLTRRQMEKKRRKALRQEDVEFVGEAQEARNNPEKYEEGEKKKYAPVRGERTPMPPRGDKRREDFEKWYAANVR